MGPFAHSKDRTCQDVRNPPNRKWTSTLTGHLLCSRHATHLLSLNLHSALQGRYDCPHLLCEEADAHWDYTDRLKSLSWEARRGTRLKLSPFATRAYALTVSTPGLLEEPLQLPPALTSLELSFPVDGPLPLSHLETSASLLYRSLQNRSWISSFAARYHFFLCYRFVGLWISPKCPVLSWRAWVQGETLEVSPALWPMPGSAQDIPSARVSLNMGVQWTVQSSATSFG